MIFQFSSKFNKQYKKLPKNFQDNFDERLKLFCVDPTNPCLRLHPLRGKYAGYWSINVNGDIRALYVDRGDTIIIFALIGTHSELYN